MCAGFTVLSSDKQEFQNYDWVKDKQLQESFSLTLFACILLLFNKTNGAKAEQMWSQKTLEHSTKNMHTM